jgi:sterol desaturase/sphingolipid hydroxylase (fatty acid hydroxylase superfamily)
MGLKRLPAWVSVPLVLGAFGLLLWSERRRPLRRQVESKLVRDGRNLAVAALGAVAVQLTQGPFVEPLAALVERRHLGLLGWLDPPAWLALPLAVVLMDYTLYLWHVLTHRVPLLWRFHVVHHADLDLSASTALRFHFGELAISVFWRAAQVFVIGVTPLALSSWQTFLLVSILFHHSNVRLPYGLERRLVHVLVTPRMHGIHHSILPEETDSNWSSGLAVWDRLHGTLRLNVAQAEITIGVPVYRDPAEVTLGRMLALPFREQPPTGLLPEGREPRRAPGPVSADRLLP